MRCPPFESFQIGWICALPIELAAAKAMLDETFNTAFPKDATDLNSYTFGRIGNHFVVIAMLTGIYTSNSATLTAIHMTRTFSRSLRIGLMVGIGGGIPSAAHDIRLGDVVVGSPTPSCTGGVIQHDLGVIRPDGRFHRTGLLRGPSEVLLTAVRELTRKGSTLSDCFSMTTLGAILQSQRSLESPDPRSDRLFRAECVHPTSTSTSCQGCPTAWEVARSVRKNPAPRLHYGVIASGNRVIRDAGFRDEIGRETGAICFEMEAAALMENFPCLVVRGICDYADSHKNKQWQGYAAITAAAYTKALLLQIPQDQVLRTPLIASVGHS